MVSYEVTTVTGRRDSVHSCRQTQSLTVNRYRRFGLADLHVGETESGSVANVSNRCVTDC